MAARGMGGTRLKPLLNCDLGEGEPRERTDGLLRAVHLANIACGGHAGDADSIAICVALAVELGVGVGAHPGLPGDFGRGGPPPSAAELEALLLEQIPRVESSARRQGVRLHHVKLHGALYHAVEADTALADTTASLLARRHPGTAWVGQPGRATEAAARRAGIAFLPEGFLDRGYVSDGRLVPRGAEGALLEPTAALERLGGWLSTGSVKATDGAELQLPVATWCVHADTPGSVELARAARRRLDAAGSVS